MSQLYFEDFQPGDVCELGTHPPLTEREIIEFARQWDPQPFHVDPERAKDSMYGGLIASGWHTAAIGMRLLVNSLTSRAAGQGSPGLERVRFLRPVRPGDELTGRHTVLVAEPSASRPSMGKVLGLTELFNQRGEAVYSVEGWSFMTRREIPEGKAATG